MSAGFAYSAAPTRRIQEIQFGILAPEEIKAASAVHVQFPETMEEGTMRPKIGGLSDPRLGTIDRNFKCQTCGEGVSTCPGHFGHIELARPVYHIGFLNRVKKILECVCVACGRLKIDLCDPKLREVISHIKNPKKRFAAVHAIARAKMVCEPSDAEEDQPQPDGDQQQQQENDLRLTGGLRINAIKGKHDGCGHKQPVIRKEGLQLFLVYAKAAEDADGEVDKKAPKTLDKVALPASAALIIFRKMLLDEVRLMGLSVDEARPEWMILTVLPVPPPPVRPSVAMDGGVTRGEDDLTYKLAAIIRTNSALRRLEGEGAPIHVVSDLEMVLQYHIATYMDNDIAGQPQDTQRKSGRPIKSIRARLKGKEGRLRGNLMGKRVDFSARTVITGDPNLDLDQVGVPKSIARNLTYPERVTPYNIERLKALVNNGPDEHPGARYIIKDSGDRIDLRFTRGQDNAAFLQYGWIVERHLQDGDIVLFNRQPSLHKMSMMAHRVKLMDYSTFRLNLSVTLDRPYNADFDGDEMNLHVPQSEETRAELKEIAAVPRQIVSPQANKPVMGIVQDTLCGVRKFTLRDCFMEADFVQNILLWVANWDGTIPPPAIIKPKPLWTGKQILSMCIPKGINIRHALEDGEPESNPGDKAIWIEDGEILYGVINKKIVGASAGGLIDVTFREKGFEVCRDLFSALQKVVNYWLLHNGFSIGIGDTIADTDTMADITGFIQKAKSEVAGIIKLAQEDRLEALPGMTIRESFESKVNTALNSAGAKAGKSAEASLKVDNNVKQMVTAGSKGSFINIAQMSACVGQQNVEGKRIPFGFKYRTLPHFAKDDFSPESRGFVENSYLRGLTPQEFFFHAMAGREGLIDTAVKTAETGYIQRRLVKALEDVAVTYDGTVRNSLNHVIQFAYGEDGMDGAAFEAQTLLPHVLSDDRFERMYRVDVTEPEWAFSPGTLQQHIEQSSLELQAILDAEYRQLQDDRYMLRSFIFGSSDPRVYLPVNIRRMIQNAQQIFHIDHRKASDLSPEYIVTSVQALAAKLLVVRGSDPISIEAQSNVTLLFRMHLRSNLASRRILEEEHLNREAFDWLLGEIESKFNLAVVAAGEMCGTLAAQSIGEPATQMTLNTFHYAGVSSKNVTLGVPRLKEIINVAVNLKTPITTVYLDQEIARDIQKAKIVQTSLAHITLKTVTASSEIFYDPHPTGTVIEDDRDFVEGFFAVPDPEIEATLDRQSPWLLRFELDRPKMLDKALEMGTVASMISKVFEKDLFVIWSEDNAEKLVIRCRAVNEEKDADEDEEDMLLKQLESTMLDDVTLGGIEGISRVFMVEKPQTLIGPAGDLTRKDEWVLEAEGINLKKVLCLDGIDPVRTYSNSPVEITEVLGIEAGRASLLREMRQVIEFDGSYVNYRHLALLCDLMTSRGQLMAITRHGINRNDTGALMRCSFEETVEILMEAASIGEKDDCKGVSENVLLAQLAPLGTGASTVMLDIEALKDVVLDHRLPVAGQVAHAAFSGGATPGGSATPYHETDSGKTPKPDNSNYEAAEWSPMIAAGGDEYTGGMTQYGGYGMSPYGAGAASPGYSPTSPGYGATSPGYSPSSPRYSSAVSPAFQSGGQSPWVDRGGAGGYSPTSPSFGLTSPSFAGTSPASPHFSPASPGFSPASPAFSPASPSFSPSSPKYGATSPSFSPASPRYSPASPRFSPTSPSYSPSSPKFSPTSPSYSPASPNFSPTSPNMSPSSPQWSPASPADHQSPTSPNDAFSPASPAYSPSRLQSPSWKR